MSLPLFYQAHFDGNLGPCSLDEDTSRHLVQVLRMRDGDRFRLTQGLGLDAQMVLRTAHKKHSIAEVEMVNTVPPPARRTAIAVAPLKHNGRYEWLLEKLTELGISDIYPVLTQRTEKQQIRIDRLHGILVSAMIQSQQCWLPRLHTPLLFSALVREAAFDHKLIAHCMEGSKESIRPAVGSASTLLLIGPEGDFTPAELQEAQEAGYRPVELGQTRLRTETAALSGAVLLQLGASQ